MGPVQVFYCDDEAKRIMQTNEQLKSKLSLIVGGNLYDENGDMNKEVMSAFLRSGKEAADIVNGVVHPLVGLSWLDTKRECEQKALRAEAPAMTLAFPNSEREITLDTLLDLSPENTLVMECALLFECVKWVDKAIELNPEDADLNHLKSRIKYESGNAEEAIAEIEKYMHS